MTVIKPKIPKAVVWGGKTETAPSDLGFELSIRVSVSRKTLSIALSVARIMCVFYFSYDLGFELPIRVSVSRKTLSIALSVARIMCVFYFSFVVHQYLAL